MSFIREHQTLRRQATPSTDFIKYYYKHKLLFQEVWMQNDTKDQDSCRPAQLLPSNSQVDLASYKKNCSASLPSLWPFSPSPLSLLLSSQVPFPSSQSTSFYTRPWIHYHLGYHTTLYKHIWQRVGNSLALSAYLIFWKETLWFKKPVAENMRDENVLENGLRMSHERFDLNQ